MNPITVHIPPAFMPVIDELVRLSRSGTREQWLANVARQVLFDYQLRKEFGDRHQQRIQQMSEFWPGPNPLPPPMPGSHP